jgi:hypothetical protein
LPTKDSTDSFWIKILGSVAAAMLVVVIGSFLYVNWKQKRKLVVAAVAEAKAAEGVHVNEEAVSKQLHHLEQQQRLQATRGSILESISGESIDMTDDIHAVLSMGDLHHTKPDGYKHYGSVSWAHGNIDEVKAMPSIKLLIPNSGVVVNDGSPLLKSRSLLLSGNKDDSLLGAPLLHHEAVSSSLSSSTHSPSVHPVSSSTL